MTAISINHVSVHAQDLERSAAFYEQLYTMTSSRSEHTGALLRHFAELRDGSHGPATSRQDKERRFAEAVALLDPCSRVTMHGNRR